ncbi:MAG TPA: acetyl-CoA carboxylase biotin carboxylase subunit [Bacteroidota bacterium]
MIKKILIANRGEIAVRIIRACREMNIRAAVVFSDVDRTAMHVRMADEAYALGGNTAAESYLRQDKILEIAGRARVDAIHPGYGFLSENPSFAEEVERAEIIFIGPPAAAIRALGDKTAARKVADRLQIPTVPGTNNPIERETDVFALADTIGYPLLLKAAAGGGGKGMRVVKAKDELSNALRIARSEAKSAFGDERIYVEKFIERPRHVEIQILADRSGNTVYLGERECSIQRRHQKVMEESPSPVVDAQLRKVMGEAATRLVRSVGYTNAGTVEFLIDAHGKFYFLEVNTRLQVEHPVTETVTGIDLVKEQIRIADGIPLSFSQSGIVANGHAIECRICAEDPENSFFPSTGRLARYVVPQGPRVRTDNGFAEGDAITMFYDPLMAKVITWGSSRIEAIEAMRRALSEFLIHGVKSTIPFCQFVLNDEDFRKGIFDTRYVDEHFDFRKLRPNKPQEEIAAALAAVLLNRKVRVQAERQDANHNGVHSRWRRMKLDSYQ